MSDEAPTSAPMSGPMPPRRRFLSRIAGIGASAQAAIPGLYAWAITVAPAAWSRGAPLLAKAAAITGVIALVTAPLVEGGGGARSDVLSAATAEKMAARLPGSEFVTVADVGHTPTLGEPDVIAATDRLLARVAKEPAAA